MIDRIQERLRLMAERLEQGRKQYNELEQTLRDLDRQLCAMQGGIQELEALLAAAAPAESISTYATGLNGTHEAALEGEP